MPCGASKAILDDLLRGELGFDGAVVADYSTTEWLITHHRVAATRARRRAPRARRPASTWSSRNSTATANRCRALIEAGEVDDALVDRSVRRVLALKEQLGLFEQPYVDEDAAAHGLRPTVGPHAGVRSRGQVDRAADATTACCRSRRNAAVAVIGPAADDVRLLQGDYSYPAHTEIVQGPNGFAAGPYYPESVTPLAGMAARARRSDRRRSPTPTSRCASSAAVPG